MHFYQQCPADHGYPRFVSVTFLDGNWNPQPDRTDTIPATQNGMGILSYLKFYEFRGKGDDAFLEIARAMGDYLVNETLTPIRGNTRGSLVPQACVESSRNLQPAARN